MAKLSQKSISEMIHRFFNPISETLKQWAERLKNFFSRKKNQRAKTSSEMSAQVHQKVPQQPMTKSIIKTPPSTQIPIQTSDQLPPKQPVSIAPAEPLNKTASRIEKWQKDFVKHGYPSNVSFIETMKSALDEISKGKDENNVLSHNLTSIEEALNKLHLENTRIDPIGSAITNIELQLVRINLKQKQSPSKQVSDHIPVSLSPQPESKPRSQTHISNIPLPIINTLVGNYLPFSDMTAFQGTNKYFKENIKISKASLKSLPKVKEIDKYYPQALINMFGLIPLAALPKVYHKAIDAPSDPGLKFHHQIKSSKFPQNHFAIRGTYPPFISYMHNLVPVTLVRNSWNLDKDGPTPSSIDQSSTLDEWIIMRGAEYAPVTMGKPIKDSDWPTICEEFKQALATKLPGH